MLAAPCHCQLLMALAHSSSAGREHLREHSPAQSQQGLQQPHRVSRESPALAGQLLEAILYRESEQLPGTVKERRAAIFP